MVPARQCQLRFRIPTSFREVLRDHSLNEWWSWSPKPRSDRLRSSDDSQIAAETTFTLPHALIVIAFLTKYYWCMSDDVLRVMALTIACLFGLWTAIACRRAQCRGLPGSDALIWAGLSGAFFLLSLMKTARGLGFLQGFGGYLRAIFKQRGWYEDRRSLQIAASIAVAAVVVTLIVWGLMWAWHHIKRYRLAIGLAGLTLGFAVIRFISLHEIDGWIAHVPCARTAVDLVASVGVSAVAIARLWQLRDFALQRARISA